MCKKKENCYNENILASLGFADSSIDVFDVRDFREVLCIRRRRDDSASQ